MKKNLIKKAIELAALYNIKISTSGGSHTVILPDGTRRELRENDFAQVFGLNYPQNTPPDYTFMEDEKSTRGFFENTFQHLFKKKQKVKFVSSSEGEKEILHNINYSLAA